MEDFAEAVTQGAQILDVRAPNERQRRWVTDSSYRYVPDLLNGAPSEIDLDSPVWLACGTGYRANIAASMLARIGAQPVVLSNAGVTDVLKTLSNKGWDQWCAAPSVPN